MSKKGGKGASKDDGEGPDATRINTALKNEGEMLQRMIVSEQERQDNAKSNEEGYKNRILELEGDFTKERENTKKIVDDMKRQYKDMQDRLMEQINELDSHVFEHESDIQNKDEQISLLDQQIKEECIEKDKQIEQLQKQIDEMSSDFAEMLKQTLSKMQERIELANVQWDNDDDNDGLLQKTIQ